MTEPPVDEDVTDKVHLPSDEERRLARLLWQTYDQTFHNGIRPTYERGKAGHRLKGMCQVLAELGYGEEPEQVERTVKDAYDRLDLTYSNRFDGDEMTEVVLRALKEIRCP